MAIKLVLNGIAYENVPKLLLKIPVLYWIELEEQAGISTDALDSGSLSMRQTAACWAYLLRRNAGESVSYKQAAVELVLEDALVSDPDLEAGEQPSDNGESPDPLEAGDPSDSP